MTTTLWKTIGTLALIAGLASCGGSNNPAVVGTWTKATGVAEFLKVYPSIATPITGGDSVTVFDDNTYIWSTDSTLDYTTDGENYMTGLSTQVFLVWGSCTLTNNTEMEEYTLAIDSVTRVVAQGEGDKMRTIDTSKPDSDNDATFMTTYCGYMKDFLSSETYTLSYTGRLTGTSLSIKTWKAYIAQIAASKNA